MISSTTWILVTALFVGSSCALAGSFLVLRKMALLGDAIAHAVLPGIVIAFLLTASRNTVPMLVGAGFFGLATVWLTEQISRQGRLYSDAAMGIVFTSLFALGVILISLFAGDVDIDQECVLYGEIAYVPWDRWYWNGVFMGPRPVWITGGVLLANIVFVRLFFKELTLFAFSPQMAVSLGVPVTLIHYGLMGSVTITTIASFESVGAILVVAMLIVPPATALLVARRPGAYVLLSVFFGITAALGGYLLALLLNNTIAGSMAVWAGVQFGVLWLLAPHIGRAVPVLQRLYETAISRYRE